MQKGPPVGPLCPWLMESNVMCVCFPCSFIKEPHMVDIFFGERQGQQEEEEEKHHCKKVA